MNKSFGALNSAGFSSKLRSQALPQPDHITYEGTFNELAFKIGPRAKESFELHTGFCRARNPVDGQVNDFLALFLKGNTDGQPRDSRILNAVIALDISGSMGCCVNNSSGGKPRLQLAKEAIIMFFDKLRNNDSFGLVVFDNAAQTLIPCSPKSQLDEKAVLDIVARIQICGGTTLSAGFEEGTRNIRTYLESANISKQNGCENRIVMLTDVNDNLGPHCPFVNSVAESGIHTTIIGISDDFQSQTCELLSEVKGFNYFCAVQNGDLKKYLSDNFDYTFFPCNYDIMIEIESKNISRFEVFGAPDSKRAHQYNNFVLKGNTNFLVTKIKSTFPSQIEKNAEGELLTHGGLILLKITPRQQSPKIDMTVKLAYKTVECAQKHEDYYIQREIPGGQLFFSEQCLQQAVSAYYFVSEMKSLINRMRSEQEYKLNKDNQQQYIDKIRKLKQEAPKSKWEDVDKMIELVKSYKFNQKPQ